MRLCGFSCKALQRITRENQAEYEQNGQLQQEYLVNDSWNRKLDLRVPLNPHEIHARADVSIRLVATLCT